MRIDNLLHFEHLTSFTRQRSGERKLGEEVRWLNNNTNISEQLAVSTADFVILGIPEDIGVRANFGRGGANTAFKPALESFLNQQSNAFLKGDSILVLGEIIVDDVMKEAEVYHAKKDILGLRDLVSKVDERVSNIVGEIIKHKKIPIIIGGGHNNAYGNIKGSSMVLQTKINAINCDPHADFRPLEGRHSGNGFSYAKQENYLNKYAVFALHEQYNTSSTVEAFMKQRETLCYQSYESIFVREEISFSDALKRCLHFVNDAPCGIEIDLDAITNVPSSAKTSSGLSPIQARQYIHQCARQLNAVYLHIAEAAPILSHIKADNKTGKLIAYLMTDFIKAKSTV
jgi:formiminoglutamase